LSRKGVKKKGVEKMIKRAGRAERLGDTKDRVRSFQNFTANWGTPTGKKKKGPSSITTPWATAKLIAMTKQGKRGEKSNQRKNHRKKSAGRKTKPWRYQKRGEKPLHRAKVV